MLLHKRRKISSDDHNPQHHTHDTAGQSKHYHSSKDKLSQGAKDDPAASSLDITNELYKVDSLDRKVSKPSVVDHDVPITPNPSYDVELDTPQKTEQHCEYDYVLSDQRSRFQLARYATSNEAYDDTVTNPTTNEAYDDIVTNLTNDDDDDDYI